MTEQLALQHPFGKNRTVHLDKSLSPATAVFVDRFGHPLLARAALAQDQDGGVAVGQILDQPIDPLHRLAAADDAAETPPLLQPAAQIFQLGHVPQDGDQTLLDPQPILEHPRGNHQLTRLAAAVDDARALPVHLPPFAEDARQLSRWLQPQHLQTRLPHRLLPRVPQDLLGRLVEIAYAQGRVHRHDPVGHRVEDRLQVLALHHAGLDLVVQRDPARVRFSSAATLCIH